MANPLPASNNAVQFDPTNLADIQLPEVVSFWPLAPGWWLLLTAIIIVLLAIIYLLKRKARIPLPTGKQLKSQAMQELLTIKKAYEAHSTDKHSSDKHSTDKHGSDKQNTDNIVAHKALKQLSILLRRYALSLYHRNDVASLTDSQWLALLDKMLEQPVFSTKFADLLTQVPYQSNATNIDPELLSELFISAEKLIKQTFKEFSAHQQEQQHV